MNVLDKHPGPWKRAATYDYEYGIVDRHNVAVVSPVSNQITEVDDLHFADDDTERLVIAAPELLAALKELSGELDACTWADMDGETTRINAIIARADAIINRIEKGSP